MTAIGGIPNQHQNIQYFVLFLIEEVKISIKISVTFLTTEYSQYIHVLLLSRLKLSFKPRIKCEICFIYYGWPVKSG